MVRAILGGSKSQTRRIVKPQPPAGTDSVILPFSDQRRQWAAVDPHDMEQGRLLLGEVPLCPYGQPGDRLWVRETWKYADWTEDGEPWISYAAGGEDLLCRTFDEDWNERLGDIWEGLSHPDNYDIDGRAADRRWRPSIHMPRWASRITLEVTGVRVEPLQDISEADARAEGVQELPLQEGEHGAWWTGWRDKGAPLHGRTPQAAYRLLWESINGAGSWDANPWVWVIGF